MRNHRHRRRPGGGALYRRGRFDGEDKRHLPCDARLVPVAVTLLAALVFGGADQYLGSLPGHFLWGRGWMTDVSLLSAPWLLLAFLAGATRRDARSAVLLGFAATYAALAGYAVLTLSPVENAQFDVPGLRGFLVSEAPVVVGGLLTGPLFGWFGQQWRTRRAWLGALVTAAALSLEPLAGVAADRPIRTAGVVVIEIAAGASMAAYVVARHRGAPAGHGRPRRP